jgi:hypothetical protein
MSRAQKGEREMREWNEAEQIRREVEREQGEAQGGRLRYKPALRRRAVAYLVRRTGAGEIARRVGEELGLPWQTLQRWQRAGEGQVEKSGAFRRVAVARDERPVAAGADLVVQGPMGLRVERLTISELAELWRSLGA